MKIILSRKGFDSVNGGSPSPIFPDGSTLSLPIPARYAPTRFGEVCWARGSLGSLATELTKDKIRAEDLCHLDPDLDRGALPRLPGWRPAFGQAGAAQSHLANQGVGPGDLFLFFGWFRQVEKAESKWRYVSGAPDLHRIFGWLQVDEMLSIGADLESTRSRYRWLTTHPHLYERPDYPRNTIYTAAESLQIPGLVAGLPGGGVFRDANEHLALTQPEQSMRSQWRLPAWFWPQHGKPLLSHHADPGRWRRDARWTYLRSAPIGQEFVHDVSEIAAAYEWLGKLFESTA